MAKNSLPADGWVRWQWTGKAGPGKWVLTLIGAAMAVAGLCKLAGLI